MSFTVVQAAGAAAGNASVTFSKAITPGNLLIIFSVTNSAGDTCTSGGHSLTLAVYSALYNNDYHAIYYLPNCLGGLTSATVSGTSPYTIGYMEVSGVSPSPTVITQTTGSSVAVTSWSLPNPAGSTADFTVFGLSYNAANGNVPWPDGFTDFLCSTFGQFSYTTSAGPSNATYSPSNTWAGASASFNAAPQLAQSVMLPNYPAIRPFRAVSGGRQ